MKRVQANGQMPKLETRANFEPTTYNAEKRTIEIVWSTGARVKRMDYWTGRAWVEELSLNPAHVRMERLNNGAPILDTHSRYQLKDQFGVVERAWIAGPKEARAVVRFSEREEVAGIVRDIVDGIIRNVSVGYKIHKLVEIERVDDVPTMRAEDWEPTEISFCPVGADPDSGTRSEPLFNDCIFETRGITLDPIPAPAPVVAPVPNVDLAAIRAEATAAEKTRSSEILKIAGQAKLGSDWAQRQIAENVNVETARAAALDEVCKRTEAAPITGTVRIEAGEGDADHRREAMTNFLMHRAFPEHYKLEQGAKYRSHSWFDLARMCVQNAGYKTEKMGRSEIIQRAFHSTSDFPFITENLANKTLRDAYARAPQTWRPFTRVVTLSDFKPTTKVQMGDGPELKEVLEGGEFTRGTFGESKETYKLKTYGRVIAVTRQLIINDDLGAFARSVELLSRRAADLESKLVWDQILLNPVMGDSKTLFHADHGNIATPSAISILSLSASRALMRMQLGLARPEGDQDEPEYLNLVGKYLMVPTALETIAQQFVATVQPNVNGSVNPFSGSLQVIVDPRLDAVDPNGWYMAGSPDSTDTVELAYLQDEQGLQVETRVGFDVDGMEIKGRLDVAAKVMDWRWIVRNVGA